MKVEGPLGLKSDVLISDVATVQPSIDVNDDLNDIWLSNCDEGAYISMS